MSESQMSESQISESQTSVCEVDDSVGFRSGSGRTIGDLYSSGRLGEEPSPFEQILYRDLVIEGIDLVHTANTYGVRNEDVLRSKERVEAWLIAQRRPSRLPFEEQRLLTRLDSRKLAEHCFAMDLRRAHLVRVGADPPLPGARQAFPRPGLGRHLDPSAHAVRAGDAAHRYQRLRLPSLQTA